MGDHPTEHQPTNPVWEFITVPTTLTLPPFDSFSPAAIREALNRAANHQSEGIEAITSSPEAPDFFNTTVAIDRARSPLFRLAPIMRLYESSLSSPAITDLATEASAVMTRADLDVYLNTELFTRLEAVSTAHLTPEDRRHHELMVADFVHAGARLSDDQRGRAAAFMEEIAALETEFGQAVLTESVESAVHIAPDSGLSLAGASPAQVATYSANATTRNLPGHVITLTSTTQQEATSALTDPVTRTAVFHASANRGARGTETDTRGIVSDLTALRAGLAGLMGYRSYKDYVISMAQAGNGDSPGALLMSVLQPALGKLEDELDTIRRTYQPERLEAEDITYYLTRYTTEHFHVDPAQTAKYFEFWRVLEDGALYAATQLYGVTFERTSEPGWYPDVVIYRAYEHGKPLGVIGVDPFARESKRGGAWMDQLVSPSRFDGLGPVITLTMNVPAPAPGEPALISLDSVRTVFHEFGHVLHGLFSTSTYATRSGASVPRDYVEFPSQFNEMWAFHPQVLPNYAVHVDTGEPMPRELVDRIRAAHTFGQGFATVEYVAAALLDLSWHSLEPGEHVESVLDFEQSVLAGTGVNPLVPPRYRSPYFQHTFSFGYSASYYAYMWSEQLAAYVTEWFDAHGGLDPAAGDAFRAAILAPGYSVDPSEAIEDFFGEQPSIGPLLRRRGLPDSQPGGTSQRGGVAGGTSQRDGV